MLMLVLLLAGCEDEQKAEAARAQRKAQTGTTVSPTGGGYLSASFRARASAQRQLGEVQRERKQQVEEEKAFDTPKKRETEP